MSVALEIRPAAVADVNEAAAYIAIDSIEAALRLYDAVDATYRQLLQYPYGWPVYALGEPRLVELRRCPVVGFPNHLVFYQVRGEVVEVIRVVYAARDLPGVLAGET